MRKEFFNEIAIFVEYLLYNLNTKYETVYVYLWLELKFIVYFVKRACLRSGIRFYIIYKWVKLVCKFFLGTSYQLSFRILRVFYFFSIKPTVIVYDFTDGNIYRWRNCYSIKTFYDNITEGKELVDVIFNSI